MVEGERTFSTKWLKRSAFPLDLLSIFLTLPILTVSKAPLSNITMNSFAYCNKEEPFVVNEAREEFLVISDRFKMANSSLTNCDLMFTSSRPKGRLCIIQVGNKAVIHDENGQLHVFEGDNSEGNLLFSLGYPPDSAHTWHEREVCTRSSHIFITWSRVDPNIEADPSGFDGTLKIVDIRSKWRRLFLEEEFCDKTFDLDDSMVEVINRLPYSSSVHELIHMCVLNFVIQSAKSKKTCFLYDPYNDVVCEPQVSDWALAVSNNIEAPWDKNHHELHLYCDESRINDTLTYCSESAKDGQISLYFNRHLKDFMSRTDEEPPFTFRVVVADWSGTQDAFTEKAIRVVEKSDGKYGSEWSDNESPSDKKKNAMIVYILLGIIFVGLVVPVMIFSFKKSKKYKRVSSASHVKDFRKRLSAKVDRKVSDLKTPKEEKPQSSSTTTSSDSSSSTSGTLTNTSVSTLAQASVKKKIKSDGDKNFFQPQKEKAVERYKE